jgi:hypothetical protein
MYLHRLSLKQNKAQKRTGCTHIQWCVNQLGGIKWESSFDSSLGHSCRILFFKIPYPFFSVKWVVIDETCVLRLRSAWCTPALNGGFTIVKQGARSTRAWVIAVLNWFFFFFFRNSFIIRESRCNYTGWIWSETRSRSTGCTHILQYSYEEDNKSGSLFDSSLGHGSNHE